MIFASCGTLNQSKSLSGIKMQVEKIENSNYGIVAFVMFPILTGNNRWKIYIERIKKETEIEIDYEQNCKILKMEIDELNTCDVLVCAFMSRQFHNWF